MASYCKGHLFTDMRYFFNLFLRYTNYVGDEIYTGILCFNLNYVILVQRILIDFSNDFYDAFDYTKEDDSNNSCTLERVGNNVICKLFRCILQSN